MNKEKKTCIIHYDGREKYSNIKEITVNNEQRIRSAKELREKLKGENYHAEQCNMIPDEIDDIIHGIHITPCYNKFTLILSQEKEISKEKERRVSNRLSIDSCTSSRAAWIYPKECNICKKFKIQHKGKSVFPKTITTQLAVDTVKSAAEKNNPDMYLEIKDLDLIAKEFKYHHTPCYKTFTKNITTVVGSESQEKEIDENKGDFKAVENCVKEQIIMQGQAISMIALHEMYGVHPADTRYRSKLKKRIKAAFPDQLCFLTAKVNTADIVISSAAIDTHQNDLQRDTNVLKVADYLRNDILDYAKELPPLSWPPPIDELLSDKRKPPESLKSFLTHLLRSDKHNVTRSENISRLIDSYSADLIHGVTRGKVITAKHFLLALGLHSQTGQKKVIEINNKLGHCLSYPLTCEIESAQARAAQVMSKTTSILPVKHQDEGRAVLTYFWVDNFDINVETQTGGGMVNSTHLVAFQEDNENCYNNICSVSLNRTKKRTVNIEDQNFTTPTVDVKKSPPLLNTTDKSSFDSTAFISSYFIWMMLRKFNSFDQLVPTYSGWQLDNRIKSNSFQKLKKTIETYLPPIHAKVTDFKTIYNYVRYLQNLAADVNMPYVNISLDVGAAINAYKVIWNYSEEFRNVVIHLGDFHFMKENFKVIGKVMAGSGFEDLVYQAEICTSGSLNGVLMGSQYNRAWFVHNIVSEALERLLIARFIGEKNLQIPDSLTEVAADPLMYNESLISTCSDFVGAYQRFCNDVRIGSFGKTAQFWIMYLDMMKHQTMAHTAVQENQFEMRIHAWEYWIPFYFAAHLFNYARYGSFYLETLKNLDELYPGLKEMLCKYGLSVQGQEKYPHRTAIDQRGEQTINRDSKTSGGIKYFAPNDESVYKWCLNRPQQAKNINALNKMAGLNYRTETYKPLRPSQIIKSECLVSKAVSVLEDEYINPFGLMADKDKLINISSGVDISDEIAKDVLSIPKKGSSLAEAFKLERISSNLVSFHNPVSRCKLQTFQSTCKSITVQKGNTKKSVNVNRNILGALVSFSVQSGKAVDIEKALEYPLSAIPLSIANADGSRRQTSKSKLMEVLNSYIKTDTATCNNEPPKSDVIAVVIDFIALARTVVEIPNTFEELALKLLKLIPSGYPRIDLVADTYRKQSIKSSERDGRGSSSQILIRSVHSKIPRDFKNFLSNGENKTRMINLIFEYFVTNRVKVLNILRTSKLILSNDTNTTSITLSSVCANEELKSNHEEADTKVILHCSNALNEDSSRSVILRSHSGDTDITVLAVSLLHEYGDRIFLDYGSGKNRKGMWMNSIEMPDIERAAITAFHAFTGNDYVSSFFRKGKKACWKAMVGSTKFKQAFCELGTTWNLTESQFDDLEEFTCHMYGFKEKKVNEVRSTIFKRKYRTEHKVPDISILPPCQSVLKLHSLRANYVACIWRKPLQPIVDVPPSFENGWLQDGKIQWIDTAFPDSLEYILLDDAFEQEFDIESDVESDVEDNNDD